ncbi:ATP-binding protein, partial [Acidithiobacillus ferrooxidans]|nr:ATP-binding protein [Acidithiobacillus ferrooxidans]
MLLQDEVARRDQRKFDTLLRQAHFRNHKTLEDFAFDRLPNLNRSLVHDLAT